MKTLRGTCPTRTLGACRNGRLAPHVRPSPSPARQPPASPQAARQAVLGLRVPFLPALARRSQWRPVKVSPQPTRVAPSGLSSPGRERSELASNFENKAGMRKIVYTGDYRCATVRQAARACCLQPPRVQGVPPLLTLSSRPSARDGRGDRAGGLQGRHNGPGGHAPPLLRRRASPRTLLGGSSASPLPP